MNSLKSIQHNIGGLKRQGSIYGRNNDGNILNTRLKGSRENSKDNKDLKETAKDNSKKGYNTGEGDYLLSRIGFVETTSNEMISDRGTENESEFNTNTNQNLGKKRYFINGKEVNMNEINENFVKSPETINSKYGNQMNQMPAHSPYKHQTASSVNTKSDSRRKYSKNNNLESITPISSRTEV